MHVRLANHFELIDVSEENSKFWTEILFKGTSEKIASFKPIKVLRENSGKKQNGFLSHKPHQH